MLSMFSSPMLRFLIKLMHLEMVRLPELGRVCGLLQAADPEPVAEAGVVPHHSYRRIVGKSVSWCLMMCHAGFHGEAAGHRDASSWRHAFVWKLSWNMRDFLWFLVMFLVPRPWQVNSRLPGWSFFQWLIDSVTWKHQDESDCVARELISKSGAWFCAAWTWSNVDGFFDAG